MSHQEIKDTLVELRGMHLPEKDIQAIIRTEQRNEKKSKPEEK